MILVSGTKRSGTSMWMQTLVAGGFPHIGSEFSGKWKESIGQANPRGFYESLLRLGEFVATNPHPRTGAWLHPGAVKTHAVKVFIPGLVRTDYAYIHRVVATMRDWRSYGPSLARLYAMEDEWLVQQEEGEHKLERARKNRSKLPAHVDWFFENYDLVRDIATRRYAVNLASYDAMLRDPEALITRVFDWIGEGDVQAAMRAIEPGLRTQKARSEVPRGRGARPCGAVRRPVPPRRQGAAALGSPARSDERGAARAGPEARGARPRAGP
ncbi:MAG: hypothetical protein KC656_01360 [Myxococcales bacterium]|nr:hypothetical protein [Myxococcales bacterium]